MLNVEVKRRLRIVEYERSVVDWGSGGYLEGYMDDCDKCNGSGELEYDI